MDYKWHDWNIEHATQHGVMIEEVERLVDAAKPPYPEDIGGGKRLVVGQGSGGRYIQVIFVAEPNGELFVIHARPLDDREKQRFRRRMR